MTTLPGFRDFYPADCAQRNYILSTWREVARRYGFVEYDGPVLEPMALYEKKSGGELVGQLFDFVDKGGRHVAMRPEMTPTLARMVAARERDFKKPLKWFCCPQFFRYEKQQRGRLREFYQFNADIIGEETVAADAELIALVIDMLRGFGLTEKDFVVRLSSRDAWLTFIRERMGKPLMPTSDIDPELFARFLAVLDKIERDDEQKTNLKLQEFNCSVSDVREWIERTQTDMNNPDYQEWLGQEGHALFEIHKLLHTHFASRGLGKYVEVDFSIVRGLAYYTGLVFEVFDRSKKERALAGGGRYDKLLSLMSDGKCDLHALGFGMGDVVLANLIADTPAAKARMDAWISQKHAVDIYVVIAKEERRADALGIVQQLRDAGLRVDFPLTAAKVGKQFQASEQLGARLAVLIGEELEGPSPQVRVKNLLNSNREDRGDLVPSEKVVDEVLARLGVDRKAC
jgi:histidyl-tRNA synthetase